MKARIVKKNNSVELLCADGTISKASASLITEFLRQFDKSNIFTGKDGYWNTVSFDMSEVPGETLAYITDDNLLVVKDPWLLNLSLKKNNTMKSDYLTIVQYAKLHDKSREMIKAYCRDGRIIGAFRMGRQWLIPADAPYPVEEKSRKPNAGRKKQAE